MKPLRALRFLWRSIPLFRLLGVPVQVHTTYLVFPWGFLAWAGWTSDGARGVLPFPRGGTIRFWLEMFCFFNLVMGLFNLLPCFPMDGGRVVRGTLAILIGLVCRRHAARAQLVATRIAVRALAWPIAFGMMVLNIGWTHRWHHLVLFVLVPLAGEAELWLLQQSPQLGRGAAQLRFLPAASVQRRARQRGLRRGPWSKIMCLETISSSGLQAARPRATPA